MKESPKESPFPVDQKKLSVEDKIKIQKETGPKRLRKKLCKSIICELLFKGYSSAMIIREMGILKSYYYRFYLAIKQDILEELKSNDQSDNLLMRYEQLYASAIRAGNLELCFKITNALQNAKNIGNNPELSITWRQNELNNGTLQSTSSPETD